MGRWTGGSRVIDFEIRLESHLGGQIGVSKCQYLSRKFYHEGCHISKISMDGDARAARYIDFVYRQSCFCHAAVTRGASNLDEFRVALPHRREPPPPAAVRSKKRAARKGPSGGHFNAR